METDRDNISAEDKFGEVLTSPRFDEETKAAARPVVPLRPTRNASGTTHRARNAWSWGVVLILACFVAVGVAATLIYRNTVTSAPSATAPTVSEMIISAVPEPESLALSNPTAGVRELEVRATTQRRREPLSAPTLPEEQPVDQDWREVERRDDDDEEKISERTRKEEKKRLKRLRKETEKMAEYERDTGDNDKPKPRLVGVYTVRRKY